MCGPFWQGVNSLGGHRNLSGGVGLLWEEVDVFGEGLPKKQTHEKTHK